MQSGFMKYQNSKQHVVSAQLILEHLEIDGLLYR